MRCYLQRLRSLGAVFIGADEARWADRGLMLSDRREGLRGNRNVSLFSSPSDVYSSH